MTLDTLNAVNKLLQHVLQQLTAKNYSDDLARVAIVIITKTKNALHIQEVSQNFTEQFPDSRELSSRIEQLLTELITLCHQYLTMVVEDTLPQSHDGNRYLPGTDWCRFAELTGTVKQIIHDYIDQYSTAKLKAGTVSMIKVLQAQTKSLEYTTDPAVSPVIAGLKHAISVVDKAYLIHHTLSAFKTLPKTYNQIGEDIFFIICEIEKYLNFTRIDSSYTPPMIDIYRASTRVEGFLLASESIYHPVYD